jgi:hypothetical protein
MALTIIIDLIIVGALVAVSVSKGFEDVLPFAAFVCILVPGLSSIPIPGLFVLTTQRLVLVVLFVLYLILGKRQPEFSKVNKIPLLWLMAAQVLWSLVSTANSIDPVMSLKKLLSVVAEYYVLYYVYVKSVTRVRTVYRVLGAIIAAMAVCSVFGAVEAYTGWHVMGLFPPRESRIGALLGLSGGDEGRIASTFPHAILFGAALAIAILIALHLVTVAKSTKRKFFLWASILLMFLNIYKSVSRGPWLGLILGFILLTVFERGKLRKHQLVIALLSVLVMVIRPGVYDTIRDLSGETFTVDWENPKGLSYEYRYELRRVAQQALGRDFLRGLWGYGMESFSYLGLEGNLAGHEFPFLSCDSAWIELMVETGYVGLFLIALLLLKPAWLAWKDFRRIRGPDRYLSLTFVTCMVVYYFMMLSVDIYAWGQEGYMLWILIALSVVHGGLAKANAKSEMTATEPAALSSCGAWRGSGERAVVHNYGRQVNPGKLA